MVVSGRPWHNDGDNPAPYLDPVTGEVTVLYRCDSEAGLGGYIDFDIIFDRFSRGSRLHPHSTHAVRSGMPCNFVTILIGC